MNLKHYFVKHFLYIFNLSKKKIKNQKRNKLESVTSNCDLNKQTYMIYMMFFFFIFKILKLKNANSKGNSNNNTKQQRYLSLKDLRNILYLKLCTPYSSLKACSKEKTLCHSFLSKKKCSFLSHPAHWYYLYLCSC